MLRAAAVGNLPPAAANTLIVIAWLYAWVFALCVWMMWPFWVATVWFLKIGIRLQGLS